MWALTAAGVGCIAAGIVVGLTVRRAWITHKIAALTAPPARSFAKENAALPEKGNRLRVVLIGDSSVARWPMEGLNDRWRLVNRGVGGETVRQVAQRFDADALDLSSDIVVVSAGLNDLVAADFLEPVARRAAIDRICETLEILSRRGAARGIRTLIATIPPPSLPDILRLPVWRGSVRDSVAEVNERLRKSSAQSGMELIDFSAALDAGDRRMPDAFRADTLHLNRSGYDRLSSAHYRVLDGSGADFQNRSGEPHL
jgi:lysophospholipase L1-like esterase